MKTIAASLVLSAGLLGAALAQNAALAQDAAPKFQKVENSDTLSSGLVGLDVYNKDNKEVGEIKDLVLDAQKKVSGYILSVGGFLGMGTHYVVVTPDSVKVDYDEKAQKWHASMNATVDQLKAAPEFKYEGKWKASRS